MAELDRTWITLTEASKAIPGRPSTSTIWRWIRSGIRISGGSRVRLEHIRVGRRIFISREDLSAFFRMVARSDWPRGSGHDPASDAASKVPNSSALEARLREAGI